MMEKIGNCVGTHVLKKTYCPHIRKTLDKCYDFRTAEAILNENTVSDRRVPKVILEFFKTWQFPFMTSMFLHSDDHWQRREKERAKLRGKYQHRAPRQWREKAEQPSTKQQPTSEQQPSAEQQQTTEQQPCSEQPVFTEQPPAAEVQPEQPAAV